MPFMSMRILGALQAKEKIIHTALDDLESFLWLLIWGIVYASKDIEGAKAANLGIDLMLDAWSGDAKSNRSKLPTADEWKDAVFGDLIREWLGIVLRAHEENPRFKGDMANTNLGSQERNEVCDELESYCRGIYREVLETGFRHLDGVREYPDWDKVVAANARKFIRRQYKEGAGPRGAKGG
jgi:hypothetical protein